MDKLNLRKKRAILRRYLYYNLKHIALALGVFYFFYFLGHAFLFPQTNRTLIWSVSLLWGAYCVYLVWAIHRRKIPVRRAELHAYFLFTLLLVNSYILAYLYPDVDYATNFSLIQIAIGAFLLPAGLYWLCTASTAILTLLIWITAKPLNAPHFIFGMLLAVGLSYILRRIRLHSILKTETVLQDNLTKRRLLAASLKSANSAQALLQERNRELQETMQALRDNEAKFRSLVELSPDIIGIHKDGKIIFINPAGLRMLEAESEEQVLGKSVLDFLHPDYHDMVIRRIKQAAETGKPVPFQEEKLITLKGNVLEVEVAAIPFTLNGETTIQVVARDISARKEYEKQLKNARESALENSRLKSQFLANISHELRTPLNGIIGMASLFQNTIKGTEQHEFLREIKHSAEVLLSLIEEVLDFSRIDSGLVEVQQQDFSIRELIHSIIHLHSFSAYHKNLEISCFIDPEVPSHITSDAKKLRKILSVLIENSIKFTHKGEIFIHVCKASETDGPDGKNSREALLFSVQDTGIGIPEEKWEIIFEPFRQLDGSHTRKAGGTGLGLALCQRLVKLLGGEIWLDSRPGRGTNFYFTVPLKESPQQETIHRLRIPDGHPVHTMLLIDKNRMSRKNLKRAFRDAGMECLCFNHLSAFLKHMQSGDARFEEWASVFVNWLRLSSSHLQALHQIIRYLQERNITLFLALPPGEKNKLRKYFKSSNIFFLNKPLLIHDLALQLMRFVNPELAKRYVRDAADQAPVGSLPIRKTDSPARLPRTLRILLAEDNPVNEKIAVKLLEKQGFQVTVARDGEEAVEKYLQSEFDLILMDIQMPKMSGIEATEAIRRHEKSNGKKTPIIAVTAHAMKGDREQLLQAGLDGYVSKPIRVNVLLDEMLRVWKPQAPEPRQDEDLLSQIEILNLQHMLEMLDYDQNLFVKMLDQFYQQCLEFPARLSLAVHEEDAEALNRYAHEIKDTASYFGAEALMGEAKALQHCAVRNDFRKASQILLQIRNIFAQIHKEIELLRQHSNAIPEFMSNSQEPDSKRPSSDWSVSQSG